MFRGLAAAIQAGTRKPDLYALFLCNARKLFNFQSAIPIRYTADRLRVPELAALLT